MMPSRLGRTAAIRHTMSTARIFTPSTTMSRIRNDDRVFFCPELRSDMTVAFGGTSGFGSTISDTWSDPAYVNFHYLQIGYSYLLNQQGIYELSPGYLPQNLFNGLLVSAGKPLVLDDESHRQWSGPAQEHRLIPVFSDIVQSPPAVSVGRRRRTADAGVAFPRRHASIRTTLHGREHCFLWMGMSPGSPRTNLLPWARPIHSAATGGGWAIPNERAGAGNF